MKKLLFLATLLLTFGVANAQISRVKIVGESAHIYDDQGNILHSINICSFGKCSKVCGYNRKYVVILNEGSVVIYNSKGEGEVIINNFGDCTIENVTDSNILVRYKDEILYYDFTGHYTGKSTRN